MKIFSLITLSLFFVTNLFAQGAHKWMTAGSLHNWFSEFGCEIEVGRSASSPQQDGLQWPAIYDFQDNQAAKGFWIGTSDFTDEVGTSWPIRIAHVGPRVRGASEFFPLELKLISKFENPTIFADGVLTFKRQVESDEIDPTIPSDRMIYNRVNTLLGISMERKILQWGQQFHDNYMIFEYEFVNTGNTDADPDIELPNQTLNDVYFFWQYRYSMTFQTRYLMGNATGWGINTMNDARGDGPDNPVTYGDPEDENFRAQFAWHGYYGDKAVPYDNIGAPIFYPDAQGYIAEYDTVGRLGAPQFAGIVTLHADKSPKERVDDPLQPSTTTTVGSDEPPTSNNSAFDNKLMQDEWNWITRGWSARHAWKVTPDGNFAAQDKTANIAPGQPGGFSFANGYGPYTMEFGDTIRIVMAEAVSGLSREMATEIGKQYKNGDLSDTEKNEWVLTGRDSLFQTFRRAIDNFESGYNIDVGPLPVKLFDVSGGGDRVSMTWDVYPEDEANIQGFNIYRTQGRVDAEPVLIYTAGPQERSFDDLTPIRGIAYYYYIEVLGNTITANPDLGIKPVQLRSNRLYTQTFDPVFLKRPAGSLETFGTKDSRVRVVPNPYIEDLRNDFAFSPNVFELGFVQFFNIPGRCTIDIYTELGEKIYSIRHTDGSGDEQWKLVTSSNQLVASGIYLAVIKALDVDKKEIVKFVVIR